MHIPPFFLQQFCFSFQGHFPCSNRCNGNFHLEEEDLWIPATKTWNRKIDMNETQKQMGVFVWAQEETAEQKYCWGLYW